MVLRLLISRSNISFEEKLKEILAQQSDFCFGNQLIELSTGQFAKFFQISSLSNARRILRRIYNSPEQQKIYKNFQVKVHFSEQSQQYFATVTPHVTPHVTSPAFSTLPHSVAANEISLRTACFSEEPFCDWLTIHQNFDFRLPELNGGCVVSLNSIPQNSSGHFDFEGSDIEFMTTKFISHKGSYETNLQLRVDSSKLTLSGNVGRFGRPDNLFGFSILDCVKKANLILDSLNLGLPNFTSGDYVPPIDYVVPSKKPSSVLDSLRPISGKGLFIEQNSHVVAYDERISQAGRRYSIPKYGYIETKRHKWTGAYITQLHLTKNLLFSSVDEASLFMDWACRQNPFGMSVHPHYGQGVNYGQGSTFVSPKLYLKGLEILKNKKYSKIPDDYRNKLLNYIENRIVRFEINYKKFLEKNTVKFLGDIMNEDKRNVLYVDFRNRLDKILGNDVDFYENLENLSKREKEQFLSWTRGHDLRQAYSRPTYYRLLKKFREVLNVDISLPYSEQHSILKIKTLACQEITQIPDFYEVSDFDGGFRLIA